MAQYRLTELQLEIMNVLWERGRASVLEVREALKPRRDLAHTTVATLLSRMEKKGVVAHRTEGRQYVYVPAVEAQRVRRAIVNEFSDVADRLFAGSITELVSHLLAETDVNADDLAKVRKLIEQKETELRRQEDES